MISSAGGSAIALRVDHTVEREVEEVFGRVVRERGRLDILVNSIAGEDPLMAQWCSFWKTDLKNAETALRQSLVSHIITAKHAAPYMIRKRSGLIVEVTENDVLSAGGNPVTQVVKFALKGLALNMAAELRPYGVSAVAVTPGFLRSETMLERFGVTEETWREGGKKDKNFLESESPLFVGRAVAALAGDPAILERSGQLLSSWELGREYRFTDADGRRPDWGCNQDRFLEASGGVAAASENRFGDPASMVERADAEDEALLRPVTTLGEPSTYAGPASSCSNAVVSTHRSERIVGNPSPTTQPDQGLGSMPMQLLTNPQFLYGAQISYPLRRGSQVTRMAGF